MIEPEKCPQCGDTNGMTGAGMTLCDTCGVIHDGARVLARMWTCGDDFNRAVSWFKDRTAQPIGDPDER